MKGNIIACIVISLTTGLALADPVCHAPQDKWMKESDFRMQLRRQGYLVKTIKIRDGCFEVYGLDPVGKLFQIYFDPATGAPLLESNSPSRQ